MSSHHIVREKQEPALLVLGLDGFSDELLGQLLEWSPTVIVTEPMAEKLNAYGIKVDWIITDGDEDIQSDVRQLPIKQNSIINTAFDFLIDNNYSAVNVVADELELNNYLPFSDKINLVIFHDQKKVYAITRGFSKWKPAGEFIELLSLSENLQVTGLDLIGSHQLKTIADGLITIQFDQPFLFIAEEI